MANHVENAMNSNNGSGWKHKLQKWIASIPAAPEEDRNEETGLKGSNGDSHWKEKIERWGWQQ
ncbi:MAG: hypothetical protein HXY46_04830 [Syntrophaceae bacterium]|nr:hypothetical protein [Syntrophaceae bacterium]